MQLSLHIRFKDNEEKGLLITAKLLVLALVICAQSFNVAAADSESSCKLKIAWGPWKPYQYINDKGELTGSQIELARYIGQQMNCELQFVQLFMADIQKGLAQGSIDFTGNITPNPQRAKIGHFSIPYARDYFALIVKSNNESVNNMSSIERFLAEGNKLGITIDHYYGDEFEKVRLDPQFTSQISGVPDSYENYELLLAGKIDGFIDNPMIAAYTIRNRKLISQLKRHERVHFSAPITYMFSKKTVSPEFIKQFNQVLKKIIQRPDFEKRFGIRAEPVSQ